MNCIKCGREIPDGELFCVECSLAPTPQEAGHGQQRAARPHRPAKTAPPARTDAKPQPMHARVPAEPQPRPKGSRKQAVALVIVCLLLAGALVYIGVNYGGLAVQKAALRAREADLTLRENEIVSLERQLADLSGQLTQAQASMTEMEAEIGRLQEQLAGSQSSMSQAQYDMTSQQQELTKLAEENTELLAIVDDLEGQVDSMNSQISQLNSANAVYSAKASFMDSYVVFVNNDGSKLYHKYDCADFTKQSFWAYSRKLAESNGYSPCPKCGG